MTYEYIIVINKFVDDKFITINHLLNTYRPSLYYKDIQEFLTEVHGDAVETITILNVISLPVRTK